MDNTELWAALASLLAVVLPLIFGSAWWKAKTGKTGAIIAAAATAAVEAQNRERVDADRANPESGRGVGKVSGVVAIVAKRNAVADALVGIARATNTPQGEIAAQMIGPVSDAIEVAVEAVKKARNPDLNPASAARLPGVLLLFALALSLSACSTLPKGWSESNPDAWDAVAVAACERVYAPDASTIAPVPTLAATGRTGAITYQAMRETKIDKGLCAAAAVRAMELRAKTLPAPLVGYEAIAAAVLEVCAVPASDADQMLGLMVGAIRSPLAPDPKPTP